MNNVKSNKCLYCYQDLLELERESQAYHMSFHTSCSKKIFGKTMPPDLPYSDEDMLRLAEKVIKSQKTITGVQPKLSLGIEKMKGETPNRFTIVGLLGEYILKPQTKLYQSLPEIEDLTMHLAEISKIKTVKHSLIYLKSGSLAYITKRVDREKGKKFHMEDMCQLTERLTEYKYKGSYEQIAKVILKNTHNPGIDIIKFYEQVLFAFLTGNSDMHLKNFSLLKDCYKNYNLCPAYDMVASQLVIVGDDEELALNLNGKKKKIKQVDFVMAMKNAGINDKSIQNIFNKFSKIIPSWHKFIQTSFLTEELKEKYSELIEFKQRQIGL